jgi:hypothetical protein
MFTLQWLTYKDFQLPHKCRRLERIQSVFKNWFKLEFLLQQLIKKSHDSSVNTVLGYGLDDPGVLGFNSWWGLGIFLFALHPEWFWGPPSLVSNGYHRLFPWG